MDAHVSLRSQEKILLNGVAWEQYCFEQSVRPDSVEKFDIKWVSEYRSLGKAFQVVLVHPKNSKHDKLMNEILSRVTITKVPEKLLLDEWNSSETQVYTGKNCAYSISLNSLWKKQEITVEDRAALEKIHGTGALSQLMDGLEHNFLLGGHAQLASLTIEIGVEDLSHLTGEELIQAQLESWQSDFIAVSPQTEVKKLSSKDWHADGKQWFEIEALVKVETRGVSFIMLSRTAVVDDKTITIHANIYHDHKIVRQIVENAVDSLGLE